MTILFSGPSLAAVAALRHAEAAARGETWRGEGARVPTSSPLSRPTRVLG